MTLEQRLQRLERENRWIRRAGMAGAALLMAMVLIGQGQAKETAVVRAQAFELVRADGAVEGYWRTGDDFGTQLAMRVSGSKGSVRLGTDDAGTPYLSLYDAEDRLSACLSHSKNPELVLYDAAGKRRMLLAVLPAGTPVITLLSADDRARAILGGHEEETALLLRDANGKIRCKVFAEPNGESGVRISDESGATVWTAPPQAQK